MSEPIYIRWLAKILRNQVVIMYALSSLMNDSHGNGTGYYADKLKQRAEDTDDFLKNS